MEDWLANHLLKFLGFFILVLGMTGNVVSLVVLCRKRLRTSKIGAYLIVLCLADIFQLITVIVYEMLALYRHSLENESLSLCKITYFVKGLASQCPSWLTVIITAERMFCISRPLSSLQRTPKPLAVVCTMLLVLIALNVVIVTTVFEIIDGFCSTIWKQHIWFVTAAYSYIPSSVLIVCNSVIIYKMCNRPTLGETRNSGSANRNTIKLVLAINIVFLLTTLPVAFLLNIGEEIPENGLLLADFMSSLNNVVNFVLYLRFSRVFRQELKSLFKIKEHPQIYALSDNSNQQTHL